MSLNRELVACGLFRNQASAATGSVATGLVATGTTQATAVLLRSAINIFGTVAASTGAVLPQGAAVGDAYVVYNGGAETLSLYPPLGGTINGGAANAAVTLAATHALEVYCTDKGGLTWFAMFNATSSAAASGSFTTLAASTSVTSPLVTAGASGTVGTVTVFPATASKGKTTIAAANNAGNTTTAIVTAEQAGARTYTVPDSGASASFVMTTGTATATSATTEELNYLDITTLGTGAASKAVVLDAGEDYTWPATGVLTYGVLKDPAGTALGATAAEINSKCDASVYCLSIDAAGAAAIGAGVSNVLLNHAAQITATIADAAAHVGLFHVKCKAEPDTTHTVTLTAGTWDGTSTIATFADILDSITVVFDADGNGTIINNTGTVVLS